MKRAFLLIVAVLITGATGCAGRQCACGDGGCGPGPMRPRGWALHRDRGGGLLANHRGGHGEEEMGGDAMSSAAVAYPYYTTRGPRDFFANNPPSIGR